MAAVSQLSSIVESGRHACYGIEWQLADGILVAKEVYNPSWRIEYAARAGLKRLFTTESTNYTFQPGDGVLVKEFSLRHHNGIYSKHYGFLLCQLNFSSLTRIQVRALSAKPSSNRSWVLVKESDLSYHNRDLW